jgi:hypothetical protein
MVADADQWRSACKCPAAWRDHLYRPCRAWICAAAGGNGASRPGWLLRIDEQGIRARRQRVALVRNADPEAADRGFRRTIAATAYHPAGFSAVAYSLFSEAVGDLNLTPGEMAVMRLVLRDLWPPSLPARLPERRGTS